MPKIQVTEENGRSRIVAFGRKVENRPELFVTVKSSSESSSIAKVIVRDADPETYYSVSDLLSGRIVTDGYISGEILRKEGFEAALNGFGSTVYWIAPK